jgi:hypothetical protein
MNDSRLDESIGGVERSRAGSTGRACGQTKFAQGNRSNLVSMMFLVNITVRVNIAACLFGIAAIVKALM